MHVDGGDIASHLLIHEVTKMHPNAFSSVAVASNSELLDPPYRRRLWVAAKNLPISRRKLMNRMAAAIYDFRGHITWADGSSWPIADVDDLFDIDGRWISLWLEEHEGQPKRQPRLSSLEKLRVIDLFFRIEYPERAALFGK